jgi:hypothetical protein
MAGRCGDGKSPRSDRYHRGQADTARNESAPHVRFPADRFTEPAVRKLLDDNKFAFRTIESSDGSIRATIFEGHPDEDFYDRIRTVKAAFPGEILHTIEPVEGGSLTGACDRETARATYNYILRGTRNGTGEGVPARWDLDGPGSELGRSDYYGDNPSRGSPQAIQRATSQGSRVQGQTLTSPRSPSPYAVYMLAKGGTQPQVRGNQEFPSRSPSADPLEGPYRALLGLDNR